MRAVGAEFAYAAGFSGQNTNIGVVDSGYFLGWTTEHAGPNGVDRWISVTATGGTTGPTPGFYNATYNDTHGTHVSGTVAAARDLPVTPTPPAPASGQMHGVSFDANVAFGNTHKTDSVYYGLQPAGAADRLLLDNEYLGNVYRTVAVTPNAVGALPRVIHSSWGSQPSTENYNTYDPPPGGPASFGVNAAWRYLSTPDGVADANGHLVHWIHGAIDVARAGTVISFSAGNGGYNNPTGRGNAPYFLPDLEGHWQAITGISTTGQTFNADGSILVPGRELFNRCGLSKWWCASAPAQSINSTVVTTVNGVPSASYASLSGTSMAGPHAASVLNLVMQRFPYMTNDQALYTMFTTGIQNDQIDDATLSAIDNPNKGKIIQVPETRSGWGEVSLRNAYRGPGQLFGHIALDTHGFSDVWSNNISDVALAARKAEDAAEAATWQATKVAKGWTNGVPPESSDIDKSDFQIGTTREAARNTRIYDGGLNKLGTGTLFMTGTNTFHGQSTVGGGKLSIVGSNLSSVSVSGGTLGGSGSITGAVSALSGIVWPGLSPTEAAFINDGVTTAGNVLTLASLKIGPGAGFATTIRSGTDYTSVQASGIVGVNGTLMVDMQGTPAPGSVLTIISAGTLLGTFAGLPEGSSLNASGRVFRISYLNNKVTLTLVGGTT